MKYFVHVPREVILFREGRKDQRLRERRSLSSHFGFSFFPKDQENREGKGKRGDKQKAEKPRDQIPPPPRNHPAKDRRAGGFWGGRKVSEEMMQAGHKEVRVRGATLPATWPGQGQPETTAQPRDQRRHY